MLDEETACCTLHLAGDRDTLIYLSPGMTPRQLHGPQLPGRRHRPAVDGLAARGVSFEQYETDELPQDEKGVMREGGPLIAWFKDPAGNTLSVLQDR